MAPREPRRDAFGARLLAAVPTEWRGETALPCGVRAYAACALRLPIGRLRRHHAQPLLTLLRPQRAQLLLLLRTQLPLLGAIEMTPLLRARLPLLRPQVPDLPLLLRVQLPTLCTVDPARLPRWLPQLLRAARLVRTLRHRAAPRRMHARRLHGARR